MKMTIFSANCAGNLTNTSYPHRHDACCKEDLIAAVAADHVCAEYRNGHRSNENFMASNAIVMDCDNDISDSPDEWIGIEALDGIFPGVSYAVVTSRHHMKQKDGKGPRPRFHIYFPIPECADADAYAEMKKTIFRDYPFFDRQALDAGRFIFGCQSDAVFWHDGEKDVMTFIAVREKEDAEFEEAVTQIPSGRRNSTLSRYAARVLKRHGDGDDAYRLFRHKADCCKPPLEEQELASIWSSALKFYAKVKKSEGYLSPEEYAKSHPPLQPKDFSDMGEAKVFVSEFGNELVYTPSTGYLRYNGSWWEESAEKTVGAMEEFLDIQYADAKAKIAAAEERENDGALSEEERRKASEDKEKAEAYKAFVKKRRQYGAIIAALNTAKPMVLKDINDLDRDGFLLNTPSMTYDLRNGMGGGHAPIPSDLITKCTVTSPGDEGKDEWLDAVGLFFRDDAELIGYVQKLVGMSAIGKVYQEALIIAHGGGRNGKSTFWNSIARVMGSYSGMISADALTVGCKRNVKPEMAELKGQRLVIAAELEEGMRLNTSIIKQLCSTDPIAAEKKYKDPFRFIPSHTLVLYTNHLPKVGALDAGTWRRLKVIPFNAKIEGKSDIKNYADHLVERCGPYILKWIIEGAEKIIREDFHLKEPPCVVSAIKSFHEDNDWISRFLDDCCDIAPLYEEKSGELYAEYRSFCQRSGDYPRHNTEFAHALEEYGFKRTKTRTGVIITGCRLKSDLPF